MELSGPQRAVRRSPGVGIRGGHTVSVIGAGYLGATHAVCMAELGFDVLAVDVDDAKIAELAAGRLPFYEPGLEALLRTHVGSGRLRFTTDSRVAAERCDVHFLCVGTPQVAGGLQADTSYLDAAFDALLDGLRGDALVVGKSTVPVGTAERLAARLRAHPAGAAGAELAWNPEFLREGFALADSLSPDRLVFGVDGPRGEPVLREIYDRLLRSGIPAVFTDLATSQLIKVAANAFLASKISFINAMSEVCDAADADVLDVAAALGLDPRIGAGFLRPGLGFGGGCLPKDIRAFRHRAEELGAGAAAEFLRGVDDTNVRCRSRLVALTQEVTGGVDGCVVAALGAAFKPDSDDVRDSPALDVSARLAAAGAEVRVYDPAATDNARRTHPQLGYADTLEDALAGSDVVLVLTEWEEFRRLNPRAAGRRVKHRRVIDARHLLDPARWCAEGWLYRAPGRPHTLGVPAAQPVGDDGRRRRRLASV